jgi:hypothetical protein
VALRIPTIAVMSRFSGPSLSMLRYFGSPETSMIKDNDALVCIGGRTIKGYDHPWQVFAGWRNLKTAINLNIAKALDIEVCSRLRAGDTSQKVGRSRDPSANVASARHADVLQCYRQLRRRTAFRPCRALHSGNLFQLFDGLRFAPIVRPYCYRRITPSRAWLCSMAHAEPHDARAS